MISVMIKMVSTVVKAMSAVSDMTDDCSASMHSDSNTGLVNKTNYDIQLA